ncbi:hypothetical protein L1887_63202 [Cichorium endivia]|nr:hypothetical protein L1887_63202 [Cichorium endivia]
MADSAGLRTRSAAAKGERHAQRQGPSPPPRSAPSSRTRATTTRPTTRPSIRICTSTSTTTRSWAGGKQQTLVKYTPGIVISEHGPRDRPRSSTSTRTGSSAGPGVSTAMMTLFPLLMYYLWICLWFYDGKLVVPNSLDDIWPFLQRMSAHVRDDAFPTKRAFAGYGGLMVFQFLLAVVMPGYMQEGLPVPSLGYKTLMYKCNALSSFYATLVTCAVLHVSGVYRLTTIIEHFGEYMTVSHDRRLRRQRRHLLPRRRHQHDAPHVGQLCVRLFHGRRAQPAHRLGRPQDVGRGAHPVGAALPHQRVRRVQAVRGVRLRDAQNGVHGARHGPLHQRVRQGRGVHPAVPGTCSTKSGASWSSFGTLPACPSRTATASCTWLRTPPSYYKFSTPHVRVHVFAAALRALRVRLVDGAKVALPHAAAGHVQAPMDVPAVAVVDAQGPALPADRARQRAAHRRLVAVPAQAQLHGRLDPGVPVGAIAGTRSIIPYYYSVFFPRRAHPPLRTRL